MSQNAGVSEARVYNMIQSEISPLRDRIDRLNGRLSALENDMSSIGNAIQDMSRAVRGELHSLNKTTRDSLEAAKATNARLELANERLAEVQMTTASGLQRNAEVALAGFSANTAATTRVSSDVRLTTSSVERNTATLVQMEFLRIFGEAQIASRKIKGFSSEVEERFSKAMEGVVLNRNLYDKHFESIHNEYEAKIRTVGEHIYRILEEDFAPVVEQRLQVPTLEYQRLSLTVDQTRLERRSEQLDANLSEVRQTQLAPLLSMHAEFEKVLGERYHLDVSVGADDHWMVPAAFAVNADDVPEFVMDASLKSRGDGPVRIGFEARGKIPNISSQLTSKEAVKAITDQVKWQSLGSQDLDAVAREIDSLRQEGLLTAEYADGLVRYLRMFGLKVAAAGESVNMGWLFKREVESRNSEPGKSKGLTLEKKSGDEKGLMDKEDSETDDETYDEDEDSETYDEDEDSEDNEDEEDNQKT